MSISFKKIGQGPALVFLHGFPMNSHVWSDFVRFFTASYTVYTPDLPGFGQSAEPPPNFSIASVASLMNGWVEENQIEDAVLIGHSLGGYVALEMIRLQPHRYAGLVLFHSTALADSPEKKESRTKVLTFIEDHGVKSFTSNFITPLFHDENHVAVSRVREISMAASTATVRGYTIAMRDRHDNTELLSQWPKKILLLGGESDKGVSSESLLQQANLSSNITLELLSEAAHMGMFERSEEAARRINAFLSGFITR